MSCAICQSPHLLRFGDTTCIGLGVDQRANRRRTLYRCAACGSLCARPMPSTDELNAYYAAHANLSTCYLSDAAWHKRTSYKAVAGLCRELGTGSILDIGCADGQLLAMLPSSFQKHGIDTARDACTLARARGIEVACTTLESAQLDHTFNIIIALDFIEHVRQPREALAIISGLLSPGGYVVIETGNAASYAARLLREDWPYTAAFGHLYALSPDGLAQMASGYHIRTVSLHTGWHTRPSLTTVIYRNALAFGFHGFRSVCRALKPIVFKSRALELLYGHAPPGAPNSDHMLFIGRKGDAA